MLVEGRLKLTRLRPWAATTRNPRASARDENTRCLTCSTWAEVVARGGRVKVVGCRVHNRPRLTGTDQSEKGCIELVADALSASGNTGRSASPATQTAPAFKIWRWLTSTSPLPFSRSAVGRVG